MELVTVTRNIQAFCMQKCVIEVSNMWRITMAKCMNSVLFSTDIYKMLKTLIIVCMIMTVCWKGKSNTLTLGEMVKAKAETNNKKIKNCFHTITWMQGVIWLPFSDTFSSVPPIDSTRGFNVSSSNSVSSIVSKLNFTWETIINIFNRININSHLFSTAFWHRQALWIPVEFVGHCMSSCNNHGSQRELVWTLKFLV